MSAEDNLCPLCEQPLAEPRTGTIQGSGISHLYNCKIHGYFKLQALCCNTVGDWSREKRALLSHVTWRLWRQIGPAGNRKIPDLLCQDAERMIESETLPNPAQMADNLVLSLGDKQGSDFGKFHQCSVAELRVQIGAVSNASAKYVIEHLNGKLLEARKSSPEVSAAPDECTRTVIEQATSELLGPTFVNTTVEARLTFKGWKRYDELERGAADSTRAFMAMKYGDDTLNRMYQECFKPAARDAGFSLERLDENAPAGLIDSRMMEMIRRSRFVVADLTYDNSGAYWEAGYGEGLGKKVIYTVSKKWLAKGRRRQVHFDTDHFNRTEWEEDKMDEAREKLADCIRNTFDLDAKVVEQ